MRSCPNCAGGLKFDIASQGLKCPNCSSMFKIGEVPETKTAQGTDSMGGMVFTCPQCGGEVFSTSETATSFCSFCGASVQLAGRLFEGTMPHSIIPFKITKEACIQKFKAKAKSFFFTPKEFLMDGGKVEFRGIYIPFWDYTVHQEATIHRVYSDEHRSGDYRIIKKYNFDWDLNTDIAPIQHDASTSLDDEIGLAISPFHMKESKDFDSAYMEGFYGDVADTNWKDYEEFALNEAVGITEQAIDTKVSGVRSDYGPTGNTEFNGRVSKCGLSMFPTWFMSYRMGNRIAYGVVNGQTGTVHADLPVSIGKFLGTTAGLTILLFFVMGLFFTPTPQMDVAFASAMTIISSLLFSNMSKNVLSRDESMVLAAKGKSSEENAGKKNGGSKKKRVSDQFSMGSVGGLMAILCGSAFLFFMVGFLFAMEVLGLVLSLKAMKDYMQRSGELSEANGGSIFPSPILAFLSAVLTVAVVVLNPVSDLWYYSITTMALVAAAWSLLSMISLRNMLSTRRLPQFDTHKGGDHRAKA